MYNACEKGKSRIYALQLQIVNKKISLLQSITQEMPEHKLKESKKNKKFKFLPALLLSGSFNSNLTKATCGLANLRFILQEFQN